ncbi:MAG: hypothetical protein LH632_00570 [Rhodoferax sp.]|nr:hypothetical protein [Rhodoferax sp.]
MIDLYRAGGNDLSVQNGNGLWVLPLPATYVIGRDGRLAFAHIDADHRARAQPADVLMQLEQLESDQTR